jgi:hypothetical protein
MKFAWRVAFRSLNLKSYSTDKLAFVFPLRCMHAVASLVL